MMSPPRCDVVVTSAYWRSLMVVCAPMAGWTGMNWATNRITPVIESTAMLRFLEFMIDLMFKDVTGPTGSATPRGGPLVGGGVKKLLQVQLGHGVEAVIGVVVG